MRANENVEWGRDDGDLRTLNEHRTSEVGAGACKGGEIVTAGEQRM